MEVDVKRVAEQFLRKKSRGGFALDAAPGWLVWAVVLVGVWVVMLAVGGEVAMAKLTKAQREYQERLKDPRWQRKRLGVLERANWSCEACGTKEASLQVHHGYYEREALPWEYPEDALWVLCDRCHERAEVARAVVYKELGKLAPWHHRHVLTLLGELRAAVDEHGQAAVQHGLSVERA